MTVEQLVLDLPQDQRWDEADFFVTACNEKALRLVQAWPQWHSPAAVIHGPPQCGKTYLARIWMARADATLVPARELRSWTWTEPYVPLAIENVDTEAFHEPALFHLLNQAREHRTSILLTGLIPPGQWPIRLPDLRSRLRSYPSIGIHPPTDEHLAAALLKHFSDLQIEIAPDVIAYLVARIERSMVAARGVVTYLDKLALSEHRKITRAFAAKAFKQMEAIAYEDGREDME